MLQRVFYVIVILAASCKPEYKRCSHQTPDERLDAYNDILNEIIVKRTYHRYLGEDEERIYDEYVHHRKDTGEIDKEVIILHNQLYNNPSKFCAIYLDTLLRPSFNSWSHYQKDTAYFATRLKNFVQPFLNRTPGLTDSLNAVQTRYTAKDFSLCIASIKPVSDLKAKHPDCFIGKIVFSELLFNDKKSMGLLYYEFRCGGLCGYGNLLLIEREDKSWKIKDALMTWIS